MNFHKENSSSLIPPQINKEATMLRLDTAKFMTGLQHSERLSKRDCPLVILSVVLFSWLFGMESVVLLLNLQHTKLHYFIGSVLLPISLALLVLNLSKYIAVHILRI